MAATGAAPDCKIDHLVPLCLGGPMIVQPLAAPRRGIEPQWNAEAKDQLGRQLSAFICASCSISATRKRRSSGIGSRRIIFMTNIDWREANKYAKVVLGACTHKNGGC